MRILHQKHNIAQKRAFCGFLDVRCQTHPRLSNAVIQGIHGNHSIHRGL